jgi:dihydroorotase
VKYLLKNGIIVTPTTEFLGSVLVKGSKISKIFKEGENLPSVSEKELINCDGSYILPGIIDPHVHLRDFQQSHKETIDSATKAAITNGVTTVIAMPNTIPSLDSIENIKKYIHKIKETANCNVGLYSLLPKDGVRNYFRELGKLGIFGIKIYPGDSPNLLNWELLRDLWDKLKGNYNEYIGNLSEFVHKLDVHLDHYYTKSQLKEFAAKWAPILQEIAQNRFHVLFHADVPLDPKTRHIRFKTFEGIHNSDLVAHSANHSKLQELFHIYFIFEILRLTDLEHVPSITFCHVSSMEAINLIRMLKQKFSLNRIFIEITPHHTYLHQKIQLQTQSHGKVLPPLRTEEDNRFIQHLLTSENLDSFFYGSDHAPHSLEEKTLEFFESPPGFPSLDIYTKFILTQYINNKWDLRNFVFYSSYNPARIYQIKNKGWIHPGYDADLLIFRKNLSGVLKSERFLSASPVCPYPLENFTVKIENVFLLGIKISKNMIGKYISRSYKWTGPK